MDAHLWPLVLCHTIIIRQKKIFLEKSNKSKKFVMLELHITCVCVCVCVSVCVYVCVCVYYIYVLLCVVVYVIVSMCVSMMIHALHCRFEVISWVYESQCVAKGSGSWEMVGGFGRIKFFLLCVAMILTKGQSYHHHCIMKKMNFWFGM